MQCGCTINWGSFRPYMRKRPKAIRVQPRTQRWWNKTSDGKTGNVRKCNNEARSCNYCNTGKAIPITYFQCFFVALDIKHAMRMRHILICGMSSSTKCFHIYSKTARFSPQNGIEYKSRVLLFSTTFVWNISDSKNNSVTCYHKCN